MMRWIDTKQAKWRRWGRRHPFDRHNHDEIRLMPTILYYLTATSRKKHSGPFNKLPRGLSRRKTRLLTQRLKHGYLHDDSTGPA